MFIFYLFIWQFWCLCEFVIGFVGLFDVCVDQVVILYGGVVLLCNLVVYDDWLLDVCVQLYFECYQQFLLYVDLVQCFLVVSFVWGLGQCIFIYDYMVWGLIGVLCGVEYVQFFVWQVQQLQFVGECVLLQVGQVEVVLLDLLLLYDVYQVSNVFVDQVLISIYVYGVNIGVVWCFVYYFDGWWVLFIFGYFNFILFNIWDQFIDVVIL